MNTSFAKVEYFPGKIRLGRLNCIQLHSNRNFSSEFAKIFVTPTDSNNELHMHT